VLIQSVIADKKVISRSANESEKMRKQDSERPHFLTFPISHLFIPPGRGELEFKYTALSYTAPEKNRFKYRLEGLDADWVDAGNRRAAFYNNTPPGDYTFRVIACNNDGVWNTIGSSVKLTLHPHYWQTWWFKSFGAIACLSLVASSARYLTKRRLRWKLQQLEQQHAVEKERTRIARDMHDDLGARLTQIMLMSDHSKQKETMDEVRVTLGKISHTARNVVDNLDALVWSANPVNDSIDKLIAYIYEFAPAFLQMSSVRCRFDVPDEIPDGPLSAEVRHNLFLVIKETLHNIVKHAGASNVDIALRHEANVLTVTIKDNGKGFLPESISTFGNGLKNMEQRMKQVGGSFCLTSAPGKGTRVRMEIPLHLNP